MEQEKVGIIGRLKGLRNWLGDKMEEKPSSTLFALMSLCMIPVLLLLWIIQGFKAVAILVGGIVWCICTIVCFIFLRQEDELRQITVSPKEIVSKSLWRFGPKIHLSGTFVKKEEKDS